MSNRGKKLAFTTATIAAIATVGSNVNAEEVTTPVAAKQTSCGGNNGNEDNNSF